MFSSQPSAMASHQVRTLSTPTPLAPHPLLQSIDQMNAMYPPTFISQVMPGSTAVMAAPQTVEQEEIMKDEGVQESVSTEVFSVYQNKDIVPGCQPHPGDIVEAGPLSALPLPDPTYPLQNSIPEEVITSGKLSSLQLEGVLYACQRHQILLPNGQRAGFFIGDAAGVGKGRQIAGIILDNYARGRTKHVWFTISSDLIVDSRRDLTDIGCHVKVIDGCQELDRETRVLGLPADFKEGVVFSTYATLVSSVQRGSVVGGSRVTRLQQLVNWCGGEQFNGCLIFDECHKAKNFVPGKEQASTKVALSVTSIQRLLPKARVLYCSATGVTDVKNMAFMERLGLWGDGAPFKSFEQFLDLVQKKGLGMAEILAMEMKSSGMYVSRGLSYKQAEFMTVEAPLTKEQRKIYDTAAHVWNELRKALESAVVRTGYSGTRLWAQFWSSHQRFFKQLCMGMKVPTVIKEAQNALENGHCIVIGLQTTGEASLEAEIGKNKGSITGFMSLCREILSRFITQYFPTQIESQNKEEPVSDSWSTTAKAMLLDFAKKISLPDSPLDEMIDKLGGVKCVAEMTGRRGRIVRHSPTDQPCYELRATDIDSYGGIESLNVQERNMFMQGKKLVAIISDAASTGISLHADSRVGNQRRRVHLTMELPWSADKAVQQLGRSHRSNQSSGPLYKLLTTDLGGERRFAAAVARRLQSLGALTKGDRRAATGANLGEFNFDTQYGRNALRAMYHHICTRMLVPGINLSNITNDLTFDDFNLIMQESLVLMGLVEVESIRIGAGPKDKDTGDVSKFLNRILGLSVSKQNLIFTYFTECMKLMIQNAKTEGRYNEGMLDITAASVEMVGEAQELFRDLNKGHVDTKLIELNIDRGMSWQAAMVKYDNSMGEHDGFYVSRREVWGKKLYLMATQKENSSHLFRLARPNTGPSQFEEEKTDILHRYVAISPTKAEKPWREQYEHSKEHCIHGPACKNGRSCRVGSRCYRMHILCGSIVTIMSVLESTLNKFSLKLNLSKSESTLRVVRVQLDTGKRVVGVRYPAALIPEVEKALQEQRMIENIQISQQSLLIRNADGTVQTDCRGDSQDTAGALNKADSQDKVQDGVQKHLETESVTPVNQKCLSKACRPPVTIKNFFKPTAKETVENKRDDLVLDSVPVNKDLDSKVHTSASNNSPECIVLEENEDCTSVNAFASDGNSGTPVTSTSGCSAHITQQKQPNKSSLGTSLSKKRSLDLNSSTQPKKRSKQASIFSSFAKAAAIKEEKEQKCMTCPVCGKEFDKEASNTDVNNHIDNCLIE